MFATIPPALATYMRMVPLSPDLRVFAIMLLAALGSAVLFGLAPGTAQSHPPGVLRATGATSTADTVPDSGTRSS